MRTCLPFRNASNQLHQAKSAIRLLICLLSILCISQSTVAQTVEEWLKEAATAEAEGRTEDAASAYSGAAHEQTKNGDHEAAGENFENASEAYRKAGKEAQANAEAKNAGNAFEKAADEASNNGNHELAKNLYKKAAKQYDAAGLADDAFKMRGNAEHEKQLAEYASAGNPQVTVKPTGTGRTIGNIANISVTNNNPFPVSTVAQSVYIPAKDNTQDYVGRIPAGIVIPPNSTVNVPVDGICVDPATPPVGLHDPMSDISSWVSVGGYGDGPLSGAVPQVPDEMNPPASGAPTVPEPMNPPPGAVPQVPDEMNPPVAGAPTVPEPMNPPPGQALPDGTVPVVLVTSPPVPRFDPEDIPDMMTSKGFNPSPPPGDIVVTWPGTNTPVGGTFNPKIDPRTYARVIVDAVESIEIAAREVQASGQYTTPFTPDPPREFEAIYQHTVWIFAAAVTGGTYDKAAFERNVHTQMQTSTGVVVTELPHEKQEEMKAGVSDFWNAYIATGVTAKVLPTDAIPGTGSDGASLIAYKKNTCECDTSSISVPVTIQVQRGKGANAVNDGDPITLTLHNTTISIRRAMTDAGHQIVLKLGEITAECHCITKEHAEAKEELKRMSAINSRVSKAIAAAKAKADKEKGKLAELDKWEKIVTEKRDINAEGKLNILWKAYMPKERAGEFDQKGDKGKREAQLKELREAINKRIEAEEKAVADAEAPLKEKEAEVEKMNKDKKACDTYPDSKMMRQGPNISVAGVRTVSPEDDGSYIFSTSSVSFYIKVDYFCIGDDCEDTKCSREIKVTFTN